MIDPSGSRASSPPSDSPIAAGPRILLVEDDDDLSLLLERRLRTRSGWRVETARTQAEAASSIRLDRFDALVLDYRLPDGDGLALLAFAREHAPTTPVLFLTAHGSEEVAMRALGLGASDYVQKTGRILDEVPARLDALLASASEGAVASRVVPVRASRTESRAARVGAEAASEARRGQRIVDETQGHDIVGVALFDADGRPVANRLPEGLDATLLGASLFQVHAQVGVMGRLTRLTPRRYTFLCEVDGAIVVATTVADRGLACVLVDPGRGVRAAQDRLDEVVARVLR